MEWCVEFISESLRIFSIVLFVYAILFLYSLRRNTFFVEFRMNNRIVLTLMLFVLLIVLFASVSAQSTGSTVKIVGVKFVGVKRQVIMRGVASELVTYVYKLNLRKGQTASIKIGSSDPELTFSVLSGKGERLGFRVKEWVDTVYSSGTYSIVLVFSREEAALVRKFAYEKEVRKRIADEETRRLKALVRDAKLMNLGTTNFETEINAYNDQTAARKFSDGIEIFKLERQIAELKAREKEEMEKVPYSLLIQVK